MRGHEIHEISTYEPEIKESERLKFMIQYKYLDINL
jgi:hypothetical protein